MTSRRTLLHSASALAVTPWLRVPGLAAAGGLAGLVTATATSGALAQSATDYPNKGVRLIVPYPAGGGTDIIARMLATRMNETWGQPMVVENRAGASGIIGNDLVAKAAPDGYTILVGITTLIQMPHLQGNLPYDVFKDFAPITQVAYSADLFCVPASNPANSLKEFVEFARKQPGKLTVGSYGNGTSSHIHAAMFNAQAKLDLAHIPFKGGAQAMTDLIGGQLTSAFLDLTSARAQLQSGKFKVLGITGERRFKLLPQVPTFTELGYKDFEPAGWFAVLAPARTPADIVAKLSAEITRILRLPEVVARIDDIGLILGGNKPEEFAAAMRRDYQVWGKVIREFNIRND